MSESRVTYQGQVLAEWTDYNGHLRDAYYLLIFSYATDGFMGLIGLDTQGREASGHSLFTLECHLNFLHEVKQGEYLKVRSQVLGHDQKRIHLYHSLHRLDEAPALAASEQMLLHVSLAGPKATPFSEQTLARLAQWSSPVPVPAWVGRVIALPERTRVG